MNTILIEKTLVNRGNVLSRNAYKGLYTLFDDGLCQILVDVQSFHKEYKPIVYSGKGLPRKYKQFMCGKLCTMFACLGGLAVLHVLNQELLMIDKALNLPTHSS